MKVHTANYRNAFIEVAEACPAGKGEMPPQKGEDKRIAHLQFELMKEHPYRYTPDDVLFQVFATRQDLTKKEYKAARKQFFSKGQPCLRSSPLTSATAGASSR